MLLLVEHALHMASHVKSSLGSFGKVTVVKHAQLHAMRDQ